MSGAQYLPAVTWKETAKKDKYMPYNDLPQSWKDYIKSAGITELKHQASCPAPGGMLQLVQWKDGGFGVYFYTQAEWDARQKKYGGGQGGGGDGRPKYTLDAIIVEEPFDASMLANMARDKKVEPFISGRGINAAGQQVNVHIFRKRIYQDSTGGS